MRIDGVTVVFQGSLCICMGHIELVGKEFEGRKLEKGRENVK